MYGTKERTIWSRSDGHLTRYDRRPCPEGLIAGPIPSPAPGLWWVPWPDWQFYELLTPQDVARRGEFNPGCALWTEIHWRAMADLIEDRREET